MARRGYRQYCGIARALDVLGERWTLLIVRNLMLGPQRFKDLLDGLPGVGTNLLTTRLRELQRAGVVHRRNLAPPAASTVYELTDYGRELEPVVFGLGRWGARSLGQPGREDVYQPAWLLLSLRALFQPERSSRIKETYELRIDGEVFHAAVHDGAVRVERGAAIAPDLVVTCDSRTLLDVLSGNITAAQAGKGGRLSLIGTARTFARMQTLFPMPQPVDATNHLRAPRDRRRIAAQETKTS